MSQKASFNSAGIQMRFYVRSNAASAVRLGIYITNFSIFISTARLFKGFHPALPELQKWLNSQNCGNSPNWSQSSVHLYLLFPSAKIQYGFKSSIFLGFIYHRAGCKLYFLFIIKCKVEGLIRKFTRIDFRFWLFCCALKKWHENCGISGMDRNGWQKSSEKRKLELTIELFILFSIHPLFNNNLIMFLREKKIDCAWKFIATPEEMDELIKLWAQKDLIYTFLHQKKRQVKFSCILQLLKSILEGPILRSCMQKFGFLATLPNTTVLEMNSILSSRCIFWHTQRLRERFSAM